MNYKKKIISITICLTILFEACFAASKEVDSYLIIADFASNQFSTKDFLWANSVLWLVVLYGYYIKVLLKILDN